MDEFSTSFEMESLEAFLSRVAESLGGELRTEKLRGLLREILEAPLNSERTEEFRVDVGGEIKLHYFIDDVDVIDLYVFGPPEVATLLNQILNEMDEVEEEEEQASPIGSVAMSDEEKRRHNEAWAKGVAENHRVAEPILAELRAAGVLDLWGQEATNIQGIDAGEYPQAVSILLRRLQSVENLNIKLAIASVLATNKVKTIEPNIGSILLTGYRELSHQPKNYQESFAQYVSAVADDQLFDEIAPLLRETTTIGRWGFISALPKMRKHRQESIAILLDLVREPAGIDSISAVEMLGNMKVVEAIPYIQPFLTHPDSWYRTQAKSALSKLERASLNISKCET